MASLVNLEVALAACQVVNEMMVVFIAAAAGYASYKRTRQMTCTACINLLPMPNTTLELGVDEAPRNEKEI